MITVVSTKEFNTHQEKYLDMAFDDHVIIKRGKQMLIVQNYMPNHEPDMIFEPDDDFYRSIAMDELRKSAYAHIEKLFAGK